MSLIKHFLQKNLSSIFIKDEVFPPLFKWYLNLKLENIDLNSLLKENENLGKLYKRLSEEYKEIESFSMDYFIQSLKDRKDNNESTEVLQKHNRLLQRIFQIFVDRNNKGIEYEKNGNLGQAIKCYEENVRDGFEGTHPYDRLGVIYRNQKDAENEKLVLCRKYEVLNLDKNILEKELKKIDDKQSGIKPTYIFPKEPINIPSPKSITLGIDYLSIIRKLPVFDFYKNKPDEVSTEAYLWSHSELINDHEYKPVLWEIQKKFKLRIEEAQAFERYYDYASASVIYEHIINEHYYMPTPYDRLIKIYSKAKLPNHEQRVLELSIAFFTTLKERQRDYVIDLAKKAGKLDFCFQRINNNEKILHYGGACELYNPFLIIESWKDRLLKINR